MGKNRGQEHGGSLLFSIPAWGTLSILVAIISFWSGLVNLIVPDPYLDEVFHVGQAQLYLEGRFSEWDPKITTPPGL